MDVVQIQNDRSFFLELDQGYRLLFKMHGKRANIVAIHEDRVVEMFRNNLNKDSEIRIENLNREIHFTPETFYNADGNLKLVLPTFGRDFDRYFLANGITEKSLQDQYNLISDLLEYLQNPDYYLHFDERRFPEINLYRIAPDDIQLDEPLAALNALYKAYVADYKLENTRQSVIKSIDEKLQKLKNYLDKAREKLDGLQKESGYAHLADLIMANLHKISPHQSEVELLDFYTQQPVKIRLNPLLSPQLNAEKYYRKSRKHQVEIDQIKIQIQKKELLIDQLNIQKQEFSKAKSLKQIKKQSHLEEEVRNLPYHMVKWMDFEILIGKNAKSNEMLTFGVAGKDDLFLHARDVPGSHVIIRAKSKQNFPAPVIEKAASYAAYYSKSKGERMVSVLFTHKKYVRKAKGKPPGTVILTNEKVILASPEDFRI